MKTIEVSISQTLSSEVSIQVPEDFEYDTKELEEYVRDQIILPSELILEHSKDFWAVDDFCVM